MELRKVRLGELQVFVESDWFQQLPVKPISRFRAESYLANPHACPDDPVLYFFEDDNRILAFRTVLPAALNAERKSFAWLSGAWTQLNYRRRGLSKKLLDEIYSDWEGRLMSTNFSPGSRKLYEKSALLHPFFQTAGRRFYLFADSRKLLEHRLGNLIVLWLVADLLIRFIASQKLRKFNVEQPGNDRWEKQAFPDRECMDLANAQQHQFLFKRGETELKWILAYPWLSTDDRTFEQSYPFSSFAGQFEVYTVKFYRASQFLGFLIYSLRDGHLKLLHQHFREKCWETVAQFFLGEVVLKRVTMLTILHPELSGQLLQMKHPFLFSRKFRHQVFTSLKSLPQNSKIQAGEGDFIWT